MDSLIDGYFCMVCGRWQKGEPWWSGWRLNGASAAVRGALVLPSASCRLLLASTGLADGAATTRKQAMGAHERLAGGAVCSTAAVGQLRCVALITRAGDDDSSGNHNGAKPEPHAAHHPHEVVHVLRPPEELPVRAAARVKCTVVAGRGRARDVDGPYDWVVLRPAREPP